jgi:hypothetical protein
MVDNQMASPGIGNSIGRRSLALVAIRDNLVPQLCGSGDSESVSTAINMVLEILAKAPTDLSITAGVYKNLAVLFERRYQQQKVFNDLQAAIIWAKKGAATDPPDDVDRIRCLCNLACCLVTRHETKGCLRDLHEAVKSLDEASEKGHKKPQFSSLDIAEWERVKTTIDELKTRNIIAKPIAELAWQAEHEPAMLFEAISRAETILAEAMPGNTIPTEAMGELSNMLFQVYHRRGNLEDLQKSITWAEQAVATSTWKKPDHGKRLGSLAIRLAKRFEWTGAVDDLESAIMHCEQLGAVTPLDHLGRGIVLNNLSIWLGTRFERTGALGDLESATLQSEQAVATTPLDHADREAMLRNLGLMHGQMYQNTANRLTWERAVQCFKESMQLPHKANLHCEIIV